MSIPPDRATTLSQTAQVLLAARQTATPIADLPQHLAPLSETEAFHVQDIMARSYLPVGGWKIGAKGPEGTPFFAPMPAPWIAPDGATLTGTRYRLRGVESEIAFHLGKDLPPRSTPYTRAEVIDAVGSCNAAIELLESAYIDPLAVPRETMFADMQMHGGFIAGSPIAGWQSIDWATQPVKLLVDGDIAVENKGSSPAGPDLVRLLLYLANEGAERTGGLHQGDWITTGTWTGMSWVSAGAHVQAIFDHAGSTTVHFA